MFGQFINTQSNLLIALALGYIVCYFANQEEKRMKTIGLMIGTFIIVLSVLLLLCNILIVPNKPYNSPLRPKRAMLNNRPLIPQELPPDFGRGNLPVPAKPEVKKR